MLLSLKPCSCVDTWHCKHSISTNHITTTVLLVYAWGGGVVNSCMEPAAETLLIAYYIPRINGAIATPADDSEAIHTI